MEEALEKTVMVIQGINYTDYLNQIYFISLFKKNNNFKTLTICGKPLEANWSGAPQKERRLANASNVAKGVVEAEGQWRPAGCNILHIAYCTLHVAHVERSAAPRRSTCNVSRRILNMRKEQKAPTKRRHLFLPPSGCVASSLNLIYSSVV